MITLLNWTLSASVLILIFLVIRFLLKGRTSMRLRYALWAVLAVRLLVPFQLPFTLPVSLALLPDAVTETAFSHRGEATSNSVQIIDGTDEVTFYSYPDGPASAESAPAPSVEEAGGEFSILQPGAFQVLPSRAETLLLGIWGTGVFLTLAVMLVSNAEYLRKLRRSSTPMSCETCPLPIYVSPYLETPCLAGLFHPSIFLTPDIMRDEEKCRHVLAHELTHYAHRDHIWAVLRCLCLAIHWFNPLVWTAALLSRRDGELACDEGAIELLGEGERFSYGRTLVDLVAARSGFCDVFACSTAMSGGQKSIQERIRTLASHPRTAVAAVLIASVVLSGSVLFVFAQGSHGQQTVMEPVSTDFGYARADEDELSRDTAIYEIPQAEYELLPEDDYARYLTAVEDMETLSLIRPEDGLLEPAITDPLVLEKARDILRGAEAAEPETELPEGSEQDGTLSMQTSQGEEFLCELWRSQAEVWLRNPDSGKLFARIPYGVGDLWLLPSVQQDLQEVSGEPERLAYALALRFPDYTPSLELRVTGTITQGNRTLLLVEDTAGPHVKGFCNLLIGVRDASQQDFVGDSYLSCGDSSQVSQWTDSGVTYLLCGNTAMFQGWESSDRPLWLRFSNGELENLTALPASARNSGVELPSDAEFFSTDTDYWENHKIIPEEAGFTLYERIPGWTMATPPERQWKELGSVSLEDDTPRTAQADTASAWFSVSQDNVFVRGAQSG